MGYSNPAVQREYQRQWVAARRNAFFKNKNCIVCSSTENLELDHIDRSKKVSHRIWCWTEERQIAEIAKCQILCRDCHHVKTGLENSRPLVHGRATTYAKHKCRCEPCKTAYAIRRQRHESRNKVLTNTEV